MLRFWNSWNNFCCVVIYKQKQDDRLEALRKFEINIFVEEYKGLWNSFHFDYKKQYNFENSGWWWQMWLQPRELWNAGRQVLIEISFTIIVYHPSIHYENDWLFRCEILHDKKDNMNLIDKCYCHSFSCQTFHLYCRLSYWHYFLEYSKLHFVNDE